MVSDAWLLEHVGRLDVRLPLAIAAGAGVVLCLRHRVSRLGWVGLALGFGAVWMPDNVTRSFGIDFADTLLAMALYHVLQWLVFFGDRSRNVIPGTASVDGRALWRRISWLHVPPIVLCIAVWTSPSSPLASVSTLLFFSPFAYASWTSVHTLQTVVVRGLEPREA